MARFHESSGHWITLPRSRFAPLGAEGPTPLVWAARAALALLAVGGALFLFMLVRPLPSPGSATGALPEAVPAPNLAPAPVERRQEVLASLTGDNPFSPDRLAWTPMQRPGGDPGSTPEGSQGAGGETAVARAPADPDPGRPTSIDGIPITKPEDLEQTLQNAYRNIELRGIRSSSSGADIAMISFVQSPTRDRSTRFAMGEEFVDDAFPKNPWRVLFIDAERDRVVLRREGKNMVVPLFRTVAAAPEPEEAAAEPDSAEATVAQKRQQIIDDLKAAGVPPKEIALLLAAMDEELAKLASSEEGVVAATLEDQAD